MDVDDDGDPAAVLRRGWSRPRAVVRAHDRWRVVDEWWREQPVERLYYLLELEGDLRLTVYHDLTEDAWFEQRD